MPRTPYPLIPSRRASAVSRGRIEGRSGTLHAVISAGAARLVRSRLFEKAAGAAHPHLASPSEEGEVKSKLKQMAILCLSSPASAGEVPERSAGDGGVRPPGRHSPSGRPGAAMRVVFFLDTADFVPYMFVANARTAPAAPGRPALIRRTRQNIEIFPNKINFAAYPNRGFPAFLRGSGESRPAKRKKTLWVDRSVRFRIRRRKTAENCEKRPWRRRNT